ELSLEGAPLDQLHGQVVEAAVLADVVRACGVAVRDSTRDADLATESLQGRLLLVGDREDLERDAFAELSVEGAVDHAHSAAPDLPFDEVATGEHRAHAGRPRIRSRNRHVVSAVDAH